VCLAQSISAGDVIAFWCAFFVFLAQSKKILRLMASELRSRQMRRRKDNLVKMLFLLDFVFLLMSALFLSGGT
jgi:hypothetical protein